MCQSMVDIQPAAAEIRRGKKRIDRKKIEITGQKYNGPLLHRAAIISVDVKRTWNATDSIVLHGCVAVCRWYVNTDLMSARDYLNKWQSILMAMADWFTTDRIAPWRTSAIVFSKLRNPIASCSLAPFLRNFHSLWALVCCFHLCNFDGHFCQKNLVAATEDVRWPSKNCTLDSRMIADLHILRCWQKWKWDTLPLYFCPVVSFFVLLSSSFFFLIPRLISSVGDWMSTILPHMVWP